MQSKLEMQNSNIRIKLYFGFKCVDEKVNSTFPEQLKRESRLDLVCSLSVVFSNAIWAIAIDTPLVYVHCTNVQMHFNDHIQLCVSVSLSSASEFAMQIQTDELEIRC